MERLLEHRSARQRLAPESANSVTHRRCEGQRVAAGEVERGRHPAGPVDGLGAGVWGQHRSGDVDSERATGGRLRASRDSSRREPDLRQRGPLDVEA